MRTSKVNATDRSSDHAPKFPDVLRFATGYWRRQPVKFGLILTLLVAGVLLETWLPTLLSQFLSTIRVHQAERVVYADLALFLSVYVAHVLLSSLGSLVYNCFETCIFKDVLDDVYVHVTRLPEHFFVNNFAGSIISRITRTRNRIEPFEDVILTQMIPSIAALVGSTLFLVWHFPLLAMLMLLYLVLILPVSVILVLRFSGPAQDRYATAQDRFTGQLADSITGMDTAKAFAQEGREVDRFLAATQALAALNARAYMLTTGVGSVQKLPMADMFGILLGGGTWYFFHGQATIESIAYLTLAYTILQSYAVNLYLC